MEEVGVGQQGEPTEAQHDGCRSDVGQPRLCGDGPFGEASSTTGYSTAYFPRPVRS